MKICLFGYGRMGRLIERAAIEKNHTILAKVTSKAIEKETRKECDIFIDFSHSSAVLDHVSLACEFQKPIIIGTTGWEDQSAQVRDLVDHHQIGAIFSPNFSIGVFLFSRIIENAAQLLNFFPDYDVSGQEAHHAHKKDAPSGTALYLAQILFENIERKKNLTTQTTKNFHPEDLNFSYLRCGNIPGTHSIIFDSSEDTITLTHQARNREGFAKGAIQCAEWLMDKKGWFTFEDFIRNFMRNNQSAEKICAEKIL